MRSKALHRARIAAAGALLASSLSCGESVSPLDPVGPGPDDELLLDVRLATPATTTVGGFLTVIVTNASPETIGWFTCEEWIERGVGTSWARPEFEFAVIPCQQVLATVAPGGSLQFQRVLSSQITPGRYRVRLPLAALVPGQPSPGIATSSSFEIVAQ